MPLHLQRRVLPATPASGAEALPFTSARFWRLRDSAFAKAATPFYQFVGHHFRWPATTFKAGIEGKIVVRLIVLPDGTVGRAEIVQRALGQAEGFSKEESLEKGIAALETEALQFMKKLRFESAASADTVAVPLALKLQ